MDFYDVVNSRRTIRDFTTDTIPEEVIERIISAGIKAPTNDHMRDWHFIVITDKSVASRCIEQSFLQGLLNILCSRIGSMPCASPRL
ncbi:MAG: nitroreductase family protein [Bacillota bacterium]